MRDPKTYNPKQIQWEEAKQHFNEVVIDCFEVCRVVGYCEDDTDVYYILKLHNNPRHQRYLALTGVGTPMWLKESLNPQYYSQLDRMLEVNGCPKESKFILGSPENWKY
jgi:hypothetical protein